jgi:hypothetical protein
MTVARFEKDRLATAMRVRLVEMRRQNPNRSFESAWSEAWRDLGPGADWREALNATKDAFRLAYYRQGGGAASLLTEREDGRIVDFPRTPVLDVPGRRCGSGEGCHRLAREDGYLCEKHSAEIHAALKRAEYVSRAEVAHGTLDVAA